MPNITKPQSPKNLALAVIWEGNEKLDVIKEATKELFDFVELLDNKTITLENNPISIRCFFVGDLKMESYVFGVQGGNANVFCTRCHVTRSEHISKFQMYHERTIDELDNAGQIVERLNGSKTYKQQLIKDVYNSVSHKPLLRISIKQNVPPPMHLIQGVLNSILKKIFKQNPET